jgi:hypothetical protein
VRQPARLLDRARRVLARSLRLRDPLGDLLPLRSALLELRQQLAPAAILLEQLVDRTARSPAGERALDALGIVADQLEI